METTRDALLGGLVSYVQPARGYRVAVEAPLLARFAIEGRARPFRTVVDLGAGPGAVALMLTKTGWAARAVAVEIDRDHAELCRTNARNNGCAVEVVERGVQAVGGEVRAELAIANPPYFEADHGAVAPGETRAGARAFTRGTLAAFVRAAAQAAPRLVLSFPAARLAELFATLDAHGLVPKRMRMIHPRRGEEADVVMLEAKRAKRGGLVVEPALFVRGDGQAYTREADDALRGRWPTCSSGSP